MNTNYVGIIKLNVKESYLMKNLCFIRKSFRFDGGAEAAAASYLLVLKKIYKVNILCESWSGVLNDIKLVKLPKAGFFRSTKYKNFISQASRNIAKIDCLSHSHELVPGANIIRLGDGLHSIWLDIRGVSSIWRWIDGFHRAKLAYERKAVTHPNLKHIITISDQTKIALINRYSVPPEKITTIRNIVTEQYLAHVPNDELRPRSKMLYVGSGFWRKGLSCAIHALVLLPSAWTLDVVGKDKEQKKYLKLVKKLGVANRVNFLGAFPMTPEVYANATVLVHPALYDPFPNVAIESLSQGTPVVSSFTSGTADFTEEQGVWSSDLSAQVIAKNILTAASVSSRQRASFREQVCKYDLNYLESEIGKIYKSFE